jgi:hypothetical protein
MDDESDDPHDHLRQSHDEVEHFRMATGLPRKKKMLVTFMARGEGERLLWAKVTFDPKSGRMSTPPPTLVR